jgi:hypothetical protein
MNYISWVNKLAAWGFPNLNAASKKTFAFFIAWTFIKWALIVAAIVFGVAYFIVFALLISVLSAK